MTQPPGWGASPPPQQPDGRPGQPAPGHPGPGGHWGPQQSWPAPAPPKKGGAGKWVIGAVALAAVIAVTAVVAVFWGKDSSGNNGGGATTSAAPSDVASANDTGPVSILKEDPTCAAWVPITNTLGDLEAKGWKDRDPSIPATSWTAEVRAQYDAIGKAWHKAADQTVALAKATPHRVMRELYTQSIAYMRAYADSIPTYRQADDHLALTTTTTGLVITYICNAISSGSAAARALAVPTPAAPPSTAPIGEVSHPEKIFDTKDPVCSDLAPTLEKLLQDPTFKNWTNTNPQIPLANWSPEQQALTDAVIPLMASTADALEKLARRSSNPMVQDFILLGVQYRRTYIEALATYQPNDSSIYLAGQYAPGIVAMACQ